MENSTFIDLKTPFERNFLVFHLARNPFPSIGVPREVPIITADRENILEQFREIYFEVKNNEKSILTVLVGEYGSGKSHLLKIFKHNVNIQLLTRENGTVAVYIKSPGEKFENILLSFIDDIGRELFIDLIKEEIIDYLIQSPENIQNKYIHNNELFVKIKNGNKNILIDDLLEGTRYVSMIDEIRRNKFFQVRNKDLTRILFLLPHRNYTTSSWKWLSGDSLPRATLDSLGVTSNLLDDYAVNALSDIKTILSIIGLKTLVILIDELEKISILRSNLRDQYQDDLRQYIDESPLNTIFYFAIAPRQWKQLTSERTALVRRLSGNYHVLEEFEEKDIEELIEKYLFTVRVDSYSGKEIRNIYPNIDASLYPFTKEALTTIKENTEGVVSRILLLCKKCLDYLHDNQDDFVLITSELVEKAMYDRR